MKRITFILTLLSMCIITGYVLCKVDNNEINGTEKVKQDTAEVRLTAGVSNILNDCTGAGIKEIEDTESTEVTWSDPLNQKYPYCNMSADWGSEVYDSGFKYYEIPDKYKKAGGEFPEVVQVYLWEMCKEKDLDYYLILALIERESGYRYDCLGDDGNSLGYMQIYEKYHVESMNKEGVTDLFDPYGNIRVGTSFLQELYEKYGSSGDNCVLMVYNMGAGGASRCWKDGKYSSEYSRGIVSRAKEIKQELTQD